jgi:hypothetical protein
MLFRMLFEIHRMTLHKLLKNFILTPFIRKINYSNYTILLHMRYYYYYFKTLQNTAVSSFMLIRYDFRFDQQCKIFNTRTLGTCVHLASINIFFLSTPMIFYRTHTNKYNDLLHL